MRILRQAGMRYVHRGSLADYDFKTADFNKDGCWHTLDLSAIVPSGAKIVEIYGAFGHAANSYWFIMRKHGDTGEYNTGGLATQVANVIIGGNFMVACDADRKVDYLAQVTTYCCISIRGWWI